MFQFTPRPALIQMLDVTRGDLFAVIAEDSHYVVRVDIPLRDDDKTRGRFAPGYVGIGDHGQPVLLRVHPDATFTPCEPLSCAIACPRCGEKMKTTREDFVCSECGATL